MIADAGPHWYHPESSTEVNPDADDGQVWVTMRSYVPFTPDEAEAFGNALIEAARWLRQRVEQGT